MTFTNLKVLHLIRFSPRGVEIKKLFRALDIAVRVFLLKVNTVIKSGVSALTGNFYKDFNLFFMKLMKPCVQTFNSKLCVYLFNRGASGKSQMLRLVLWLKSV